MITINQLLEWAKEKDIPMDEPLVFSTTREHPNDPACVWCSVTLRMGEYAMRCERMCVGVM
jgi:hypothetical protein